MIALTGPSASGKTETAKYLMAHFGLKKVVTCTTRSPRVGEMNDVDYHFLTREEFREGIEKGEFLEHAEYNGNLYGTKKVDVGPGKVSCIEANGVKSYRKYLGSRMFCVYLDADEETRLTRMISLRKDPLAAAQERIIKDRIVYKDNGRETKAFADLVVNTDGLSVAQEAEEVYLAYCEWKKSHKE